MQEPPKSHIIACPFYNIILGFIVSWGVFPANIASIIVQLNERLLGVAEGLCDAAHTTSPPRDHSLIHAMETGIELEPTTLAQGE